MALTSSRKSIGGPKTRAIRLLLLYYYRIDVVKAEMVLGRFLQATSDVAVRRYRRNRFIPGREIFPDSRSARYGAWESTFPAVLKTKRKGSNERERQRTYMHAPTRSVNDFRCRRVVDAIAQILPIYCPRSAGSNRILRYAGSNSGNCSRSNSATAGQTLGRGFIASTQIRSTSSAAARSSKASIEAWLSERNGSSGPNMMLVLQACATGGVDQPKAFFDAGRPGFP